MRGSPWNDLTRGWDIYTHTEHIEYGLEHTHSQIGHTECIEYVYAFRLDLAGERKERKGKERGEKGTNREVGQKSNLRKKVKCDGGERICCKTEDKTRHS